MEEKGLSARSRLWSRKANVLGSMNAEGAPVVLGRNATTPLPARGLLGRLVLRLPHRRLVDGHVVRTDGVEHERRGKRENGTLSARICGDDNAAVMIFSVAMPNLVATPLHTA
jgi:hypothetical protein